MQCSMGLVPVASTLRGGWPHAVGCHSERFDAAAPDAQSRSTHPSQQPLDAADLILEGRLFLFNAAVPAAAAPAPSAAAAARGPCSAAAAATAAAVASTTAPTTTPTVWRCHDRVSGGGGCDISWGRCLLDCTAKIDRRSLAAVAAEQRQQQQRRQRVAQDGRWRW